MHKRIQGNGSITIPVMLRRSLGIEPRDTMDTASAELNLTISITAKAKIIIVSFVKRK